MGPAEVGVEVLWVLRDGRGRQVMEEAVGYMAGGGQGVLEKIRVQGEIDTIHQ